MADATSNNKRIAKNTMLLYIRMFLMMVITLYTSRIVLQALGVVDYGVFNVVAGVVTTLGFFNGLLSSASQRFITFSLGKGDVDALKKITSNCIAVHLILAGVVVLILETIGLWFLNAKLNIPPDRNLAANVIFQCSIVTFVMNIWSIPYNAMIIAHEKMSAFAYISIFEAAFKLIAVYCLLHIQFDRLILYGVITMLIAIIIRLIYSFYCVKHFIEGKSLPRIDKDIFRSILSFSGYNVVEIFANMLSDQGLNIMLNILFGPVVNAARGIALQVNNSVQGFINNFTTALNPQITKSYASGDMKRMQNLMYTGNRLCFFLFLLLVIPLFYRTQYVLDIWLKTPPEYCATFIKLILIYFLIIMLTRSYYTGICATGDIKKYQLTLGMFKISILPVCYFLLKFRDSQPTDVYYIIICYEVIGLMIRTYLLSKRNLIDIATVIKSVYAPCLFIGILSFAVALELNSFFESNFLGLVLYTIVCVILVSIIIALLGLNKQETHTILSFIRAKIKK